MKRKMIEGQTSDKLLNAFLELLRMGYPVATFAKLINRDSSTLYKWADGSRQISNEIRAEVEKKIKEMKNWWINLEI